MMSHAFLHRRWAILLLLIGTSALIALGSLYPVRPGSALGGSRTRLIINNLLHVPAYAVLAVLWSATLAPRSRRSPRPLRLCGAIQPFIMATGYGALMELAQVFVPGRMGSVPDVLINAAGAALGVAALWAVGARAPSSGTGILPVNHGLEGRATPTAISCKPLPQEPAPEWAD